MKKLSLLISAFTLLFILAACVTAPPQNREAVSPGATTEASSTTNLPQAFPLVSSAINPVILAEYAGTYDLRPTAFFQFKVEDGTLWLRSLDGKTWDPLVAESETTLCMLAEEPIRFEFIRDMSGDVTGLNFEYNGIRYPPARKMKPE